MFLNCPSRLVTFTLYAFDNVFNLKKWIKKKKQLIHVIFAGNWTHNFVVALTKIKYLNVNNIHILWIIKHFIKLN